MRAATEPVRILIADDHEIVRRGMRSLFSLRANWEICGEAVDGRDAVEKAKQLKPDVILLDVSMPLLNGLEAARLIRREVPDSEIVMVSQHDAAHMRSRALEVGANGYVAKSDLSRDLLAAIEAAIRDRGPVPAVPEPALKPSDGRRNGNHSPGHAETECLAGGGEMGALMRSLAWSRTGLGPVEKWPQSLRTSVSICLNSRFPIVVWWGPDLLMLYNDAYRQIIGSKHPMALANPGRECWHEIWPTIAPMLEGVMSRGEATWSDDLQLLLERHGYAEECYFTFSYSPIRDESGGIGGVFTPVKETTEKVIGERRLRTLRDLAVQSVEVQSEKEAWQAAAQSLAGNLSDIPFSILCAPLDCQGFRVVGTAGIDPGHPLCSAVCAPGSGLFDRASQALASGKMVETDTFGAFSEELPCGSWGVQPRGALLIPIAALGQDRPSGLLLAAVNPRKALDASYRTFFELLARQIANALADARGYEQERRRAEVLTELDRAKTLFFSNVSHEFRTPLTLLLGPLEQVLAQFRTRLPDTAAEQVTVAHRNGLRLLKLVNTLLDFSRIEAGRIEAAYEPTDLAQFTEELASNFRSLMEKGGLEFQVQCEPLKQMVYVDRAMWEKIVLNLLSNAFKFTLQGSVFVCLRQAGEAVALTVRDTGVGIPEEERQRIFERFHRVGDVQGRSHEGSGIGLALVHDLAQLHGGSVAVESRKGQGSTFTVSIPLGFSHLPRQHIKSPSGDGLAAVHADSFGEEALRWLPGESSCETARPAGTGTVADKPLILFAEDNADMRDYVRRLLSQQYRVTCVPNGADALIAVRDLRPDLLLTDVMMPGTDGFRLLGAIRNNPATRTLPVILLSVRAGEDSEVEGLEAGADDYLVKPFGARELRARVSTHLQMAKLRRQAEDASASGTRLFRLVADSAPVMIWVSDADGHFQYFNRAWFEFTGCTANQELRQEWIHSVHPDDRLACQDAYDSAFQSRLPLRIEYRLRHADGSYRWLLDHGIPRYSEDAFVGYIGSCIDITDRKLIEETKSRLAAIVESSDDAIVAKDLDGTITSWNAGAQRMFEYTANEVVGKPITLIVPPELHEEEREILRRLRKGERLEHFETSRVTKTGKKVDVSLSVSPVKDASGRIVGASKIARDISERKQAEAMWKQVHDQLESRVQERTAELEKAQDDLRALSTRLLQMQDEERRRIARELHDAAGQILAALSMNLSPLEDRLQGADDDLIKPITESIRLVNELSKDLRTISHLLHPPLLDEAGLASALRWFVEGFAERSKIPVDLRLAPDLGRLSPDLETTIFRVVQECLTNIHRHSGSPSASIAITRHAKNVHVEIRDWGKGMSLQFRSAAPGPVRPGVGIQGMKERVRQLGGKFEIQSGATGTVVRVRLPEDTALAQEAS